MKSTDREYYTIDANSPEFEELLKSIIISEKSKEERYEMSLNDFRQWVHDTVRAICDKLGVIIQNFEEFWKNVGQSLQFFSEDIAEGFNTGRARVRRQAELKREQARLQREKQALLRKMLEE